MILSLLFFPNLISISLAIIAANLPDFDHDIKKSNLYKILIIGLLLSIILYLFNLPFFIGIIICVLPFVFYFSHHRGFTHSLLGIIILSILVFIVVIMGVTTFCLVLISLEQFNLGLSTQTIAIYLIIMALAILTLNKKLIIPFCTLFLLGVLFLPVGFSTYYFPFFGNLYGYIPIITYFISYSSYEIIILILFPLFLGFLSHLILDSFTPGGIEVFQPFSSKRFHKNFGVICLFILGFFLFFIFQTFF